MKRIFLTLSMVLMAVVSVAQQAPKAILPVPTAQQMQWHKMERYAMICFGMSTFNDMEWGFGDSSLDVFAPVGGEIDVDQWVRVCKAAGMDGILLVAKHHDGFVLWQSKLNDYGVKNTSWRGGKGDIVKDLDESCKRHGLKMALYLSPWDRNHAEYGRAGYVTYFHNQIAELMRQYPDIFEYWFDGANGGDGYYGGAREKRSIADQPNYYEFPRAVDTIKKYAPSAMIFGGDPADLRWIGNEEGWAGATNWAMFGGHHTKGNELEELTQGSEFGQKWLPGEVDVSIRPGWYYHASEDNKVKSLAKMVDVYYNSVGRNAALLLSFCPDRRGRIHELDSMRAVEWWQTIQNEMRDNVLKGARVKASAVRGAQFAAAKINDGKYDSYWATPDGVTTGSVIFKLSKTQKINRLLLQEYIPLGQRVAEFDIEIGCKGVFSPVEVGEQTTTIGYKRILRFKAVAGDELRINFRRSRGELCINNIEAFLAPNVMVEPAVTRNEKDEVAIKASDAEAQIYYTTDGSEPTIASTCYTKPFVMGGKGQVKAVAYDLNFNKMSAVTHRQFDISQSAFSLVGDSSKVIFDNNPLTAQYFDGPLVVDLGAEQNLCGVNYFPDQNRWGGGVISDYVISVGNSPSEMREVARGQFSNIKNNPIEQFVTFAPVEARFVRLQATRIVDNVKRMGVGDLNFLTK